MLGEERVHAEPVAALESRHEEVGALDLGEHVDGVGAIEYRVAQLRGELTEHGEAFQEDATVVVESREDL